MSNLFVKGINPEIEKRLREYCEQNGLTLKEAIEEAISLLLEGGGKNRGLRMIIAKYPGTCSICKTHVNSGELVYWDSQDKKLVCVACYSQAHSNLKDAKRVYELYKQIRRLKALRKIAEQELEEIIQRIDVHERVERLHDIANQLNDIIATLNSYTATVDNSNVDLKQIIQLLTTINDKLDEYLATHSLQIRKAIKIK
ncbi:MAG: hypothetical protein QXT64_06985 [Desulfurococcaceae archaeon]